MQLRSNKGREFEEQVGVRKVQRFGYFATDTAKRRNATVRMLLTRHCFTALQCIEPLVLLD